MQAAQKADSRLVIAASPAKHPKASHEPAAQRFSGPNPPPLAHVARLQHVLAHAVEQRLPAAAWVEAACPALDAQIFKQQRLRGQKEK